MIPENSGTSRNLKAAGAAAREKSDRDVNGFTNSCDTETGSWIEFCLEDDLGNGIADRRCIVIDCDGGEHRCKTDAKGILRVEGIPEGECRILLVDVDVVAKAD